MVQRLKVHSIKTDNFKIDRKIDLRKNGTKDLIELNVLDLFAGENKLWGGFDCKKYYGIEIEKNKGKNLNADNTRVIPSLDLSRFNVIDCDSYGIPFNQINAIYNNATLKPGTVIFYTAITNKMSGLNKDAINMFNLSKIYKKCKTLLNGRSLDMFYGMLYEYGVKEVTEYKIKTSFDKRYGYFIV